MVHEAARGWGGLDALWPAARGVGVFGAPARHFPCSNLSSGELNTDYTKKPTMSLAATRVFLVRHGATVLTAEDRFAGAVDVELSDLGRDQAGRLAARLRDEDIAAVYASDLSRAVETATIVAAPHRLEVTRLTEFREISHGHWEELTRDEVEERFPQEVAAWDDDPYSFAPAGGETGLQVTARALPALLGIVRAHRGGKILVVSHKATIRLLLSSLLGFDPRRYRDNLDQSPAALNVVDFREPTRARLTLYNDTSHYAEDGFAIPPVPGARLSKWWE
jgi:broad specificity phosphatase PhoE